MTVHRCPEHLVRLFDTSNEKQKRRARAAVIKWLEGIRTSMLPGDVVLLPDPNTGVLMSWERETLSN